MTLDHNPINREPSTCKRLALGTVQFGMPYGLANKQGQVPHAEAAAIIARARAAGLDTLDTAVAYGTAEQCLGDIGVSGLKIVTKLPGSASSGKDVSGWVERIVSESLVKLRVEKLFSLTLHRPNDLLGPQGDALYQSLQRLKTEGQIAKIGISVYSPAEIEAVCARYVVDLVQAPFNVLDRRLIESGWLDCLQRKGIELHVRSVFLQGLLLMAPSTRPAKFQRWQELWHRWDEWLGLNNLTPLAACLRYALGLPGISRVVVGVDSLTQFEQILMAVEGELVSAPGDLCSTDLDLLNPARWPHI